MSVTYSNPKHIEESRLYTNATIVGLILNGFPPSSLIFSIALFVELRMYFSSVFPDAKALGGREISLVRLECVILFVFHYILKDNNNVCDCILW